MFALNASLLRHQLSPNDYSPWVMVSSVGLVGLLERCWRAQWILRRNEEKRGQLLAEHESVATSSFFGACIGLAYPHQHRFGE
jgi:hypothetical protein